MSLEAAGDASRGHLSQVTITVAGIQRRNINKSQWLIISTQIIFLAAT